MKQCISSFEEELLTSYNPSWSSYLDYYDYLVASSYCDEEYILKLIPHHVWNFFDELGALVSCPRLWQEPNIEYKNIGTIKDDFELKQLYINYLCYSISINN